MPRAKKTISTDVRVFPTLVRTIVGLEHNIGVLIRQIENAGKQAKADGLKINQDELDFWVEGCKSKTRKLCAYLRVAATRCTEEDDG